MLSRVERQWETPLYADFARSEFAGRVERMQELLAANEIDVLVLWDVKNLRYFTGFHNNLFYAGSFQPATVVLPADGEPVILERRHLVAGLCGNPGRRDLGGSFYEWLGRVGVKVTGTEQRIRAVHVPEPERKLLQLDPEVAVLRVHAVGRAGVPIWVEDTDYRGDRYEFHNVLTDGLPTRPARATLLQP